MDRQTFLTEEETQAVGDAAIVAVPKKKAQTMKSRRQQQLVFIISLLALPIAYKVYMHEFFDATKTVEKYMHSANEYADYLPDEWRTISEEEKKLGHGGMDYLEFKAFFRAILNGEEMPIDVYDMAAWMAITPLSEQSIAHGGMPQAIPDFTRGKWMYRPTKDVVNLPTVQEEEQESKNEFGYSRK